MRIAILIQCAKCGSVGVINDVYTSNESPEGNSILLDGYESLPDGWRLVGTRLDCDCRCVNCVEV